MTKKFSKEYVGVALFALVSASAVDSASAASNTSPAALKDDTYLSLSGRVGEIYDADEFELKLASGSIRVDTNDYWPNLFQKDALEILKPGDQVTVTGVVDDNFFTKKEIDATSITHENTSYSRIYRNPARNASPYSYWYWSDNDYESDLSISGTVSKVLSENEFQMKYGTGMVKVDTSDVGMLNAQDLKPGDRVMVYGDIDNNWFGKRELEANYIVRTNVYQPRG